MKQPTLVVIDDDPLYVASMVELLSDEGYIVAPCLSSRTALDTIQHAQPDLVILDLRLEHPESGLLILDMLRLHRTTASIPVLLCTGDQQWVNENGAVLRDHHCAILVKPFSADELLEQIRAALIGARS